MNKRKKADCFNMSKSLSTKVQDQFNSDFRRRLKAHGLGTADFTQALINSDAVRKLLKTHVHYGLSDEGLLDYVKEKMSLKGKAAQSVVEILNDYRREFLFSRKNYDHLREVSFDNWFLKVGQVVYVQPRSQSAFVGLCTNAKDFEGTDENLVAILGPYIGDCLSKPVAWGKCFKRKDLCEDGPSSFKTQYNSPQALQVTGPDFDATTANNRRWNLVKINVGCPGETKNIFVTAGSAYRLVSNECYPAFAAVCMGKRWVLDTAVDTDKPTIQPIFCLLGLRPTLYVKLIKNNKGKGGIKFSDLFYDKVAGEHYQQSMAGERLVTRAEYEDRMYIHANPERMDGWFARTQLPITNQALQLQHFDMDYLKKNVAASLFSKNDKWDKRNDEFMGATDVLFGKEEAFSWDADTFEASFTEVKTAVTEALAANRDPKRVMPWQLMSVAIYASMQIMRIEQNELKYDTAEFDTVVKPQIEGWSDHFKNLSQVIPGITNTEYQKHPYARLVAACLGALAQPHNFWRSMKEFLPGRFDQTTRDVPESTEAAKRYLNLLKKVCPTKAFVSRIDNFLTIYDLKGDDLKNALVDDTNGKVPIFKKIEDIPDGFKPTGRSIHFFVKYSRMFVQQLLNNALCLWKNPKTMA